CLMTLPPHRSTLFPYTTLFRSLVVNISGSLIIGLFATLTDPDGRWLVAPSFRQFFMVGICGGYTTFSSFSLQTLNLVRDGEWFRDRKSTRLNSSHVSISYAVFC